MVTQVHELEKHLISPEQWKDFYSRMPRECQEVADGPSECLGIGFCDEYGWFILGSGQGPHICWSQNQ